MTAYATALPLYQFFDANGDPLVGGKLYSYAAGTTTPLATYTDSTGTIPNTNPIILDANGQCQMWLGANKYKLNLTDASGVQQNGWPLDNVTSDYKYDQLVSKDGSSFIGFSQTETGSVYRTVEAKLRDCVSVEDFGAIGDGVTDDTNAIQSAVNTGKPVAFSNGKSYRKTAPITYTGKAVIYGNGCTIIDDGQGFTITDGSGSYIRDLNFQPVTTPYTIKRNSTVWKASVSDVAQSFDGYIPNSQDFDLWGASAFTATITGSSPNQTMTVSGMTVAPGSQLAVGQPIYYPNVNIPENKIGVITSGPLAGGDGTYTIQTTTTQSLSGVTLSSGLLKTVQDQVYQRAYQRPGLWFTSSSASPNYGVTIDNITGYLSSIVMEGYQYSTVKNCRLGGSTGPGTISFHNGLNFDTTGTIKTFTYARGMNNCVIDNETKYASYCGIVFFGNDFYEASGNSSHDNGESGIKTYQHDANYSSNVACTQGVITNNKTYFNFYDGIDASTVTGLPGYLAGYNLIGYNQSYNNRATGITVQQTVGSSVIANTCQYNGTMGINAPAQDAIISSNNLKSNCMFSKTGVNNQWGNAQAFDLLASGDNIVCTNNNIVCAYLPDTYAYIHSGALGGSPTVGKEGMEFGNTVTGISSAVYIDPNIPSVRNGLTFPKTIVESSDTTTLDAYEEYRATPTACIGAVTTSVSWKLTRIGAVVTLQLPATIGTGVASGGIRYGVAIPARFRPTETMEFYVALIKDNNAFLTAPGLVQIDTSGNIDVFKNINAPNFTAGQPAGLFATTVSWMI